MANAGRKTKRTPDVIADIIRLLEAGNTDSDVCAAVGVAQGTFIRWINENSEFREAVTRARAVTRQLAVAAIHSAMQPYDQAAQTAETFTETRLDKKGQPYNYTRTKKSATVTKMQGDWRAAESYLKRRDPDNWSEQFIVKIEPAWAEKLKQHGLTPMQAMEKLINALDKVDANG